MTTTITKGDMWFHIC